MRINRELFQYLFILTEKNIIYDKDINSILGQRRVAKKIIIYSLKNVPKTTHLKFEKSLRFLERFAPCQWLFEMLKRIHPMDINVLEFFNRN